MSFKTQHDRKNDKYMKKLETLKNALHLHRTKQKPTHILPNTNDIIQINSEKWKKKSVRVIFLTRQTSPGIMAGTVVVRQFFTWIYHSIGKENWISNPPNCCRLYPHIAICPSIIEIPCLIFFCRRIKPGRQQHNKLKDF